MRERVLMILRDARSEIELGLRRSMSLAMSDQGVPWNQNNPSRAEAWKRASKWLREALGIQIGLPWYERDKRPSKAEKLAAFDRAIALAEQEEAGE